MSSVANPVSSTATTPKPDQKLPWVSVVWFAVLLSICYAPVLWRLVKQWNDDEDMGHGFFVPVIAGYIAWQRRNELFAAPVKSQLPGSGAHCVRGLAANGRHSRR